MSVSVVVPVLVLLLHYLHGDAARVEDAKLVMPHSYEVSIKFVGRHVCLGAIIGPKHILTAAHCFTQNNKKYPDPGFKYMSIVSGINGDLSESGHVHKIKNVTTHEDLSSITHEYWMSDIALVTLASEITFSKLEQPIEMAESDLSETARGRMSIWNSPVESLETVEVYFISHRKCTERLKEKFLGEHDKKICGYTRTRRGFCLNNDGSPLLQNGKLIGIASKSEGCRNGSPDVYTSVQKNKVFIDKAIALTDS